jgi:hypothetical protein
VIEFAARFLCRGFPCGGEKNRLFTGFADAGFRAGDAIFLSELFLHVTAVAFRDFNHL